MSIAALRPRRSALTRGLAASVAVAALGLSACSSPESAPAPAPTTSAPAPEAPSSSAPSSSAPSSSAPSSAAPSSAAPTSSAPSSDAPSESTAPSADAITIAKALQLAQDEVDGPVVEADLDRENQRQVWDVEIRRSANQIAEIRLDAGSGEVIFNRNSNDVPDEARSSAPRFTAAQAIRAAERRGDGRATQVDLGDEGATRTWQVTVRKSGSPTVEITLNADSGAYIGQENDD